MIFWAEVGEIAAILAVYGDAWVMRNVADDALTLNGQAATRMTVLCEQTVIDIT